METYGVTFEGFRPDWGIDYYRRIEQVALPKCDESIARLERKLMQVRGKLERLRCAKSTVRVLVQAAQDLESLSLSPEGDDALSLPEILSCPELDANRPEDRKRRESVDRVKEWMAQTQGCREDIAGLFEFAQEVAAYSVRFCERQITSFKTLREFYVKSMEVQRGCHVFDHADRRYKTAICRDMIRLLSEVCRLGAIVLMSEKRENGGAVDGESSIAFLREDANRLYGFFRAFKKLVSDVGVDEACNRVTIRAGTSLG